MPPGAGAGLDFWAQAARSIILRGFRSSCHGSADHGTRRAENACRLAEPEGVRPSPIGFVDERGGTRMQPLVGIGFWDSRDKNETGVPVFLCVSAFFDCWRGGDNRKRSWEELVPMIGTGGLAVSTCAMLPHSLGSSERECTGRSYASLLGSKLH